MNRDAVLYYSKNGTTRETVDRIRKESTKNIDIFDLKDMKMDLRPYETLFVGCGIYTNKLPGKVAAFLAENKEIFAAKKSILFLHGLISESNYMDVVNRCVKHHFKFHRIFYLGGKLDMHKQNFVMRPLLLAIVKQHHLDSNHPNNLNETMIAELLKCF